MAHPQLQFPCFPSPSAPGPDLDVFSALLADGPDLEILAVASAARIHVIRRNTGKLLLGGLQKVSITSLIRKVFTFVRDAAEGTFAVGLNLSLNATYARRCAQESVQVLGCQMN